MHQTPLPLERDGAKSQKKYSQRMWGATPRLLLRKMQILLVLRSQHAGTKHLYGKVTVGRLCDIKRIDTVGYASLTRINVGNRKILCIV
jgi:hypothetical protein